jgi:GntR family transcriptional regulator, transcriptional repressor for pyruvate dehydrogenase complex
MMSTHAGQQARRATGAPWGGGIPGCNFLASWETAQQSAGLDSVGKTEMKTFSIPRIRRGTLTDQAIESLLGLLHDGKLKPGDRLPPQRELASLMGLSATVVREAVRGLASMKVVEVVHGRGAYVRQVSPKDLIRPEALFSVLDHETLLHAIEVRAILEVEVIALAAERHTPDDLMEMERALSKIERALASGRDPLMHSPAFHAALAAATHNPVLTEIIKPFIELMARGARIISANVPHAVEREWASHSELYEAIRAGDPELARARMRAHLEEAKHLVLQGFTQSAEQNSETRSGI